MNKVQELKRQLKAEKIKAFNEANSQDEVISAWNEDKRASVPKDCKKMFCAGCRNNFYNQGGGGAKECWSLEKAKLCKRKIYRSLDSVRPDEVITLSCFTKQYH